MPALANAACRTPEAARTFELAQERGGNSTSVRQAKAICARCWDRPECLVWGLENNEAVGIWGGHGGGSRYEMRKQFGISADRTYNNVVSEAS